MYNRILLAACLTILICEVSTEEHELIYNNDIVYYDECRITVSPRNHSQPVYAFAQLQKPCNGTLLWTYPRFNLTLTMVNLENETFTLCFEKKTIENKLVHSIRSINLDTNEKHDMYESTTNSGILLCTASNGNRVSTIIEAKPLYAGVYIPYAMFSNRHPWTSGPYPGFERSEKYLFGPHSPVKTKKRQRNRKKQN